MTTPTALITGGTTGIGRVTAELLHERGYRVMITGANPATLAAAREALPDDVIIVDADSRSLSDADRLAEAVRTEFGTLTTVFLNAGVTKPAPIEAIDEGTYDDLFAINTKGQFFTLQKVMPFIADGSSIIFTVGIGATRGLPGGSATAASKGALLSMVPALAIELAPRRIRVNAVSPGSTETPIWAKLAGSSEAATALQNAVADMIPFGRIGTAREVAETVAFLASDGAAYITGQNICVGGGSGVAA